MLILLICHHLTVAAHLDARGSFKCGCPVKSLSIVREYRSTLANQYRNRCDLQIQSWPSCSGPGC
ncbi:hypothetical protein M758_UG161100 [Ceratodon purpureus]|nr:hypothetical protein M758_UG161100 [Ceratodon purpureus]